jgi:hypothetical protein
MSAKKQLRLFPLKPSEIPEGGKEIAGGSWYRLRYGLSGLKFKKLFARCLIVNPSDKTTWTPVEMLDMSYMQCQLSVITQEGRLHQCFLASGNIVFLRDES